ncbi:hypothetical protein NEOLEDRAFT_1130921 [Neolentinus lepideus HHB14362 ss-1]|uniref:Uncharacterized protein n=1 Tax=Neolentinus lepideus HHB14362 ss-1 TaxID=1314782 RepID=A0A165TZ01_9AGAM|nr:hypothetical protein NEOLEDRAFT_1130921 [Neolentinus lepideus HHB14362 ss-1]
MSIAADYVQFWTTRPENRPKYQAEPETEISSVRPVDEIEDIPDVTYRMWAPPKSRTTVTINGITRLGSSAGFFKQVVAVKSYPAPSDARVTRTRSRAMSVDSRYTSTSVEREGTTSGMSEGKSASRTSSYGLRKARSSVALGTKKSALAAKRESSDTNTNECASHRKNHTCSRLTSVVPSITCQWGHGCTAKVHRHGLCIKAHVESAHLPKVSAKEKANREVYCQWDADDDEKMCGETIKWQSFPRHVEAEKHLGLSRECPVCGDKIGDRTDAIKRHLKGSCKGCQAPGCKYRMTDEEVADIPIGLDVEKWDQHTCPHPGTEKGKGRKSKVAKC